MEVESWSIHLSQIIRLHGFGQISNKTYHLILTHFLCEYQIHMEGDGF